MTAMTRLSDAASPDPREEQEFTVHHFVRKDIKEKLRLNKRTEHDDLIEKFIEDKILPNYRENNLLPEFRSSSFEHSLFTILVLTVIMSQPHFFMRKLVCKDPEEMFKRAKSKHDLEFYQFYEWI